MSDREPELEPLLEADTVSAANKRQATTPTAPPDADDGTQKPHNDLLEYLEDDHRRFGLTELSRVQSIGYFLPLLHEIFGGGEAKTKLTFTLIHALMTDDRVRWSRQELDEKFHWLKDGHRNYLLQRLSSVGWLEYYRDRGVYMITDKGEALMRILSRFVMGPRLVENEGAALAEIEFSMLLELEDLPDRLTFLRNRLMKHAIRAEHALNSESAYRILEIYEQLKSAYRWAEQTRQTLDHIEVEDDDTAQWEAIRGVHDHLSKLHSLISTMQLTLQDIQRKQIDIARYGLTHLDIDHYLIHANVDELSDTMYRHLAKVPHPFFLIEDNVFAEADDIINRERYESGEGRGWETDIGEAEADLSPQTARETDDLVKRFHTTPKTWTNVEHLVQEVPWEEAAYRYSILTLMADLDVKLRLAEAAFDPIVSVPVEVTFSNKNEMVTIEQEGEPLTMTKGKFKRVDIEPPATDQEGQNHG